MAFFGLIKNKCFYCRSTIEKGTEHLAKVRILGYTGLFEKNFCSKEHAQLYTQEIEAKPKQSGGGCCH